MSHWNLLISFWTPLIFCWNKMFLIGIHLFWIPLVSYWNMLASIWKSIGFLFKSPKCSLRWGGCPQEALHGFSEALHPSPRGTSPHFLKLVKIHWNSCTISTRLKFPGGLKEFDEHQCQNACCANITHRFHSSNSSRGRMRAEQFL